MMLKGFQVADNDLIIKITAETNKALGEIKKLTKEVEKLGKAEDKSTKTTLKNNKAITKSYKGVGISLKGIVTSMVALGVAAKAIEFTTMAAEAEQSADAFKRVFEDMGLVAEQEFQKIKDASMGLIPDAAIRQSAVTAASLGVPVEKLTELMEIARVKAREMGTDTKSAFNDLAIGIGRGSPMILDNLGLTIKLEDANKKYAEELGKTVKEMSKQEKQMALTNAVIEAGADSLERFKDAGTTAKQNTQKLNAELDNMKVKIGKGLLPVMDALTVSSTTWLSKLDDTAIKKVSDRLLALGKTLKAINDYTMPDLLTEKDAGLVDTIAKGWGAIFDHLEGAAKLAFAMDDTVNIFGDVREKAQDIKEFKISLSDLGSENDKYKGSLDRVKQSYNEQSTELQELLAKNLKLQEFFRAKDPVFFADQLGILKNAEEELNTQSITLGETYSTIFGTTAKEAVNILNIEVTDLTGKIVELKESSDNITIEPELKTDNIITTIDRFTGEEETKPIKKTIKIDEKKSSIEISNTASKLEKAIDLKIPAKIDEKSLDESTKKAINAIGDKYKLELEMDENKSQINLDKTISTLTASAPAVEAPIEFYDKPTLADVISDLQSKVKPIIVPIIYVPQGNTKPPSGYATGGYTGSGADTDVAGVVHKNEFVVPASAVRSIGVNNLYDMIRNMRLPGYADGGLVGGSSEMTPINLNVGGNSFSMMSDTDVAEALQRYVNSQGGL